MGVELDMVLDNIQYKINSYQKRLMELDTDGYESEKYRFYIQCLEQLGRDLMYPSPLRKQHIMEELLEEDYNGRWDTKIIFKDESSLIIKYDDLVKIVDGFIVFYDKEEYENDITVIPPITRLVALEEVREVYRLEE